MRETNQVPLLITSAVMPSVKVGVTDSRERMQALFHSLDGWLRLGIFKQIVVCDGSDFDLSHHFEKKADFIERGIKVEFLHFRNDAKLVNERGKGYGEGEILKYALANSVVLNNSSVFAKCTSKLWVKNAKDLISCFNGVAGFSISGFPTPVFIDTRFYIVSKKFYNKYLLNSHEQVDDVVGRYLEHVFLYSLRSVPYKTFLSSTAPNICGLSGSMGLTYTPNMRRVFFKSILFKAILFFSYIRDAFSPGRKKL